MHGKWVIICLILILTSIIAAQTHTVKNVISAPEGYTRKSYPHGSFSAWLQNLPLKNDTKIARYDGGHVWRILYRVWAVADRPLLFKQDLEQCADYCMRFWADYHKESNRLGKLYLFDYNGNRKMFSKSGKSYRNFIKWAMAYSNSYSLKRGCKKVTPDSIAPGDMFVQNTDGGIGHVSLVVDACENKKGEKLYLIGYSFMPAQEFHLEKAKNKYGLAGWFTLDGYLEYLKQHPFDGYGKPVLRRFVQL